MEKGTVGADPACLARSIANRGGQNSGNAFCPMKYIQWQFYVSPLGRPLISVGSVEFRSARSWSWSRPREFDGYNGGPVLRYRKDLDPPGLRTFCTSQTGTRINALPGDLNHAGDALHTPSCSEQIRVNDTR
jgi:hypothetical protein